ncbi:MAG TPA: hypothetical protein VM658_08805 [bacterium]|nr:hypothetical protein [bacterium]
MQLPQTPDPHPYCREIVNASGAVALGFPARPMLDTERMTRDLKEKRNGIS